MRNLLLCLGFGLPLLGACAPHVASSNGIGSGPDAPQLGSLELAQKFFETGPGRVPDGGEPDAGFLGMPAGSMTAGMAMRVVPVPGYPGAYNVVLRNTGSGYAESFVLQIPSNPPPGPRPMLVAFHRANVSHADAFLWTQFPAECQARGWYFVAPLGGSQRHFSSIVSQINTRRALELVAALYPIDTQRIYGVGFSMGGGAVATYAARHNDASGLRFAALVNHTGTVSISDAFAKEFDDNDADDGVAPSGLNLESPDLMEFWNGGTPAQVPFSFQRCSTIDLDPLTGLVGSGTDLARNFGRLKVMTVLASGDTNLYLPQQTQTWAAHLAGLGVDDTFVTVPFNGHSWDALDAHAACDWMDPIRLTDPTAGNQLADEDGQAVERFHVRQDAGGGFTPFQWNADSVSNRLSVWGTKNLKRLELDATSLGLAYLGTLRWNHAAADGSADEMLFTNVPSAPLGVFRDGQPASCVYDAQAQTCLVSEADPAGHQWQLQF